MKNKTATILIILFCSCFLVVCKKKKENEKEPEKEVFDKQAMLTNIADNLILPSYNAFKIELDSLVLLNTSFQNTPTLTSYQALKNKFKAVYFKYQLIDIFEFGPAEMILVRANCNTFPTDTVQINSNINSGSYDLSLVSNLDAKGFPALEFLLFGNAISDNDAFNLLNSNQPKKQYLANVIFDISTKINMVIAGWNNGYKNTFTNSLGTDVGSSIGYMVNQINYQLDYLKNAKIGIPLGKKSLGVALPRNCEAYYTNQSVTYAKQTLAAIESLYLGKSFTGIDGIGFDDYLIHLEANYNSGSLAQAIANQFTLAKTKLNNITNPLSQEVTTNPAIVNEAYIELVKLLVLLKTDMPSNLGVVITYQDGDGD